MCVDVVVVVFNRVLFTIFSMTPGGYFSLVFYGTDRVCKITVCGFTTSKVALRHVRHIGGLFSIGRLAI